MEVKNMNENLREALYDKAAAEYDKFIEDLKQQTPEKIISSSYQKVIQEDILMSLEPDNMTLTDEEVEALLTLDNPLADCYERWMDNECSYMEDLRNTITDFASELISVAQYLKKETEEC